MISIAKRNIRIFFRDRSAVFFSLLAVFIIIGLYVLFLGDVFAQGMGSLPGIRFLMDSWIMAGLLAVTSVTTTMGAFGVMVEDRSNKTLRDFLASPLKRRSLVGGYVISSFAIGVIMSVITLVLAEIYIVANGGELLSLFDLAAVLGLILLSVFAGNAMVLFMVSFFRSQNAFATACTVIGTLIGFLTGIYIPISQLPPPVQLVIKVFPVSHAGALLRRVMMERPLSVSFAGAPQEAIDNFSQGMGIYFRFGDTVTTAGFNIAVLVATAVLFYALALWNVSRKQK